MHKIDAAMMHIPLFCHFTHSPFHFHSTMHSQCSQRSLHFFCSIWYSWAVCVCDTLCVYEACASECGKNVKPEKIHDVIHIEFMKKHLQWLQNIWNCLHLLCPETDTRMRKNLEYRTANITRIQSVEWKWQVKKQTGTADKMT